MILGIVGSEGEELPELERLELDKEVASGEGEEEEVERRLG